MYICLLLFKTHRVKAFLKWKTPHVYDHGGRRTPCATIRVRDSSTLPTPEDWKPNTGRLKQENSSATWAPGQGCFDYLRFRPRNSLACIRIINHGTDCTCADRQLCCKSNKQTQLNRQLRQNGSGYLEATASLYNMTALLNIESINLCAS